ncbi:hypothetical protein QTP88_028661 [Uroleucon formosanum]
MRAGCLSRDLKISAHMRTNQCNAYARIEFAASCETFSVRFRHRQQLYRRLRAPRQQPPGTDRNRRHHVRRTDVGRPESRLRSFPPSPATATPCASRPSSPRLQHRCAQHLRLPRARVIRIPLLSLLLLPFRTPGGACRRVAARAEPISCAHYSNILLAAWRGGGDGGAGRRDGDPAGGGGGDLAHRPNRFHYTAVSACCIIL